MNGNAANVKNVNAWRENAVNGLNVKDLSVNELNVIAYSASKENVWNANALSVSD